MKRQPESGLRDGLARARVAHATKLWHGSKYCVTPGATVIDLFTTACDAIVCMILAFWGIGFCWLFALNSCICFLIIMSEIISKHMIFLSMIMHTIARMEKVSYLRLPFEPLPVDFASMSTNLLVLLAMLSITFDCI